MVNLYSRSGSDPQLLFSPSSNRLVGASLSCTLVGNAISTGLLAYRLWIAEVRASKYRVGQDGHMIFVARIVINSGAIYLVSQVLFLGLYFARSNAFFIVEDLLVPIIAICFYMVILRAAHHKEQDHINSITLNNSAGVGVTVTSKRNVEIHLSTDQVHSV
ncbi:hypothetical protein H2248_005026 [Termitomyces sp. 'cryptogamus']|nr:hypothetical protein H2248_005026 [Termitomyces sp. 'cryptogamus']